MKPHIFIIVSTILFYSLFVGCEKSKQAVNVDHALYISFVNSNGTDLLNSTNSNSFKQNEIKCYWLNSSQKVNIPFSIEYNQADSIYFFRTIDINNNDLTYYLELNQSDRDTLKVLIESGVGGNEESYSVLAKLYYNGVDIPRNNTNGIFRIIK